MKTPPFLLIGCPILILVAGLVYALTYSELRQTAFHAALIDAEKPAEATASETNSLAAAQDATFRQKQIQRVFAALGLSDAQKEQIAHIRQTITDHAQRRAAIMNVLTPAQQAQWQQMRDAWHKKAAASSPPASTNTN